MTDPIEVQRIEVAIRKAVVAILEKQMPIGMAVRAAAVALLQGDPDPAATFPRKAVGAPARQNQDALHQMALLQAEGRGRDAAVVVAKRQVSDPRDPEAVRIPTR